jgi:hypothetical protein
MRSEPSFPSRPGWVFVASTHCVTQTTWLHGACWRSAGLLVRVCCVATPSFQTCALASLATYCVTPGYSIESLPNVGRPRSLVRGRVVDDDCRPEFVGWWICSPKD